VPIKSGGSKTFTAEEGTPPFRFSFKDDNSNNSGATLTPNPDGLTAVYTAGAKVDLTDVIRVTDNDLSTADATIKVAENLDPDPFSIGPDGDTLVHPSGFSIEIPKGALDTNTTCIITFVETPEAFPARLDNASQAFNVELGEDLLLPVKRIFENIDSAEDGALGIYVLEGGDWAFAGGMQVGTTVYSYVKDIKVLSLLRVGTAQKLHKPLSFEKYFGESWTSATVAQYKHDDKNKDVPISKAYSWPVNVEETVFSSG